MFKSTHTDDWPVVELQHEQAQHERLPQPGLLDACRVEAPDATHIRRARTIGTAGLTIGLLFVGLIVYAVAR